MSLFQCRDWWSHKPDQKEECDRGCLCVANIDNDPKGQVKVVTGSFQGYLRIYTPRQQGYKVDDLMEFRLDDPILQLEAGRFVGQTAASKLSLAVLHPRKLVVYNVVAIGSSGKMVTQASEATSYYDLNKVYEHRLERTAYNMCYGSFGGVYGKDYIAVQSMDGQLSFFEQESFAFSRFLPNALVPGALTYVAKTDSFVTANAHMEVECYKYQVLGASQGAEKKQSDTINNEEGEGEGEGNDGSTSSSASGASSHVRSHSTSSGGTSLQADWRVNLGEYVHSLFVARYSRSLAASQVDLLVVGEQTLFTLRENGTIRIQKRLDFNPAAAVAYNHSPDAEGEKDVGGANQNLIVATHQHSLMIYKDMQLMWAARTTSVPVAVRVATFAGVKGMIVALSDSCEVSVSYLGTDPPLSVSGVSAENGGQSKELDYESMDAEHRSLLRIIKQASTDSLVEPKEKLILSAQVQGTGIQPVHEDGDRDLLTNPDAEAIDPALLATDPRTGLPLRILVKVFVSYNGNQDLENVNLALKYSAAFECSAGRHLTLPNIRGGARTPLILTLRFRPLKGAASVTPLPVDLNLHILASYITPNNEPRTARLDTRLPLSLAVHPVPPLKNASYLFTLDTNRPPPNSLVDLFPDLLDKALLASSNEIARTASNVLTLVYYAQGGHIDVTILVSKKSGRYRIQSGVFEALNLVTESLVQRLENYYAQEDARMVAARQQPLQAFEVRFNELLPLHDYFQLIDRHFEARGSVGRIRSNLERCAAQFRAVQKRLLVRYKDKTPAPLMQLDTIMEQTYNEIQEGGSQLGKALEALHEASAALSSATSLLLHLMRYKYGLDVASFDILRAHMPSEVGIFDSHAASQGGRGWEEVVETGVTALLRTALAKGSVKDAAAALSGQSLETCKDTNKIKRHMQIMCDRLAKGMKIVKPDAKERKATNNHPRPAPVPPAQSPTHAQRSIPQQQQPQQQQAAPPPVPQRRRAEQETLREEGE